MKRELLFVAAVALLGSSCKKPRNGVDSEEHNMVYLPAGDSGMNAAIANAKSTSGQFLEALRNPKPTFHDFSLKKPYKVPGGTEHLWIAQITDAGDHLEGIVANDPVHTREVRLGDSVTVRIDEISDWKYVDGKKLVGGYTIRYELGKLDAKERQSILDQAGFTLE